VLPALPGQDTTYKFSTSCSAKSSFAFPARPTGTFLQALQRGTVRISYNANTYDLTPDGFVLADSRATNAGNPVVAGVAAQFLNAVVSAIGAAYNVKYLALTWVTCASSDICFDQLANSQIDILWGNLVMPSAYNSAVPRFYAFTPSPCLTWVTDLTLWVTPTSQYNTVQDFLTAYQANPTAFTIAAVSGGTQSTAKGFFKTSNVSVISDTPTLFTALNNGTVSVAVGSSPVGSGSGAKQLTGSSIVKMVSSFQRRPLLLGANSTTALSLGTTAYPPVGNAEAAGIEELKFAYAAAFAQTVAVNNSWSVRLGGLPNVFMTEACTVNQALYKYPVPTPGGQLANILTRRSITLAVCGCAGERAVCVVGVVSRGEVK
jgi:ABC-type amino acid transport substrate-binding protein